MNLQVRIPNELRTRFSQVRILRDLASQTSLRSRLPTLNPRLCFSCGDSGRESQNGRRELDSTRHRGKRVAGGASACTGNKSTSNWKRPTRQRIPRTRYICQYITLGYTIRMRRDLWWFVRAKRSVDTFRELAYIQ